MKHRAVILIILLVPLFLPEVTSQSPLVIVPLNDSFTGLPGDTIIIPFQLKNLGNVTLSNVSVYVTGPAEGFLYGGKVIRQPVEPNGTVEDTVSIKLLNLNPGVYNLTLVARAGSSYSEARIKVHVGTLVDYSLRIDVGKEYTYGSNVTAVLGVKSGANGVIIGRLGYTISRDGSPVKTFATSVYLLPGESWAMEVNLTRPEVGDYSVYFWANFGGKFKSTRKTFRVYQRNLNYEARFRDGAIYVRVYGEKGQPVSGIPVTIDGIPFQTGEDGTVSYLVDKPGTYEIVMNLDGRIVKTFVEVKKLFLSVTQENETLLVRVLDSTGQPVPNVTVTASGSLGTEYSITNSLGVARIDLEETGHGTVMIRAESRRYVGGETTVNVAPPVRPTTSTSTTTPETKASETVTTTTPTTRANPPRNYGPLAGILFLAGVIFAGASYVAFFLPIVQEEMLDRYYFVKVKAPRLRGVDGFHFERGVKAIEVRATKGRAEVKDGVVVWEVEHLEPEEEAYLQVILG